MTTTTGATNNNRSGAMTASGPQCIPNTVKNQCKQKYPRWKIRHVYYVLTPYGLVALYGDIELDKYWFG